MADEIERDLPGSEFGRQQEADTGDNGEAGAADGEVGDSGGAGEATAEQAEPSEAAATPRGDGHNEETAALAPTVVAPAEEAQRPALTYPVVGLGASAGGLQACKEILENLDPNTGMAFVLVTHLAPDQRSFLSEILERYTQMPVHPIEDGQRPLPNHVYVLLPNQSLTLHGGMLRVELLPATERLHKPIDKFFYSLAADQKNHAVGVVLSGADADGALGLKTIKGEGGIALVQSPESATHPGMPRSSIASDHVDLVIPPAEIAIELGRLAHQFTRPEVRSLEAGSISLEDEQPYQKVLQLLHSLSGIDLRKYKPETIRRRIARRMMLLRMDHLSHYLRFLQIRHDELRALQEDVLINVTHFFRDPPFWESLGLNVLPALFQNRPPEKPLRIWCAGCSTGEEAYSLAILVLEFLSQHGIDTPVQVFGTDASDRSVETARLAIYPETAVADISQERLRRFFVKVDRGCQVSKRLRDTCIFARQNLANDPPFSHIDILSCRNVMIYFNQALQRQIMRTFHYALDPGGYIVLGMSEGLHQYGDTFETIDRKHKIYMKTGVSLPFSYEPPRSFTAMPAGDRSRRPAAENEVNLWPELELQRAADRIVLARFGPPGLVIDERMTVLQARGQISRFMQIAPGTVTWSLPRVLKDQLVNEVSAVVQRAIRENMPTSATVALIEDQTGEQTGEQHVQIDVLPITSAAVRPRCFVVLFQTPRESAQSASVGQPAPIQPALDEKDRLIAQLRQDLTSTHFHLQSLIEERDARNQELVSVNEEIQSANEELQSTNEELETTKEELESANEELQTVNNELEQRNSLLTQTGNDLTNLLTSINVPLLMLDSDLRIRQFTPPMQRLLSVRPADVGRSIGDIRLQLSIDDIQPILHEVQESLVTREIEVQDREGCWYVLRVRPYRTAENKIEGLVVMLMDINQLRRSQQSLVEARDFARSVVESVPVPVVALNEDCSIRSMNSAFRSVAGMEVKELEGRSLPDLMSHLWGIAGIREKLDTLLKAPPGSNIEFEQVTAEAERRSLLIKAQVLSTDGSRVMLLMLEDVTLRRAAEWLAASQKEMLQGSQDELRHLTSHLFTVQEQERQRVARELHDDVSQRLSLLEMLLHEIDGLASKEAVEKLDAARNQIASLNTDVRQISHRLHPAILHDLGLSAALQALVAEFGERENMPATYVSQNLPENWPSEAATAIYRIAQEALRNVSKHAGKTHVKVILAGVGNQLQLKITDFGTGFDQEAEIPAQGLGMISMQERARLAGGTVLVRSALGQGTTVTAEVPVDRKS